MQKGARALALGLALGGLGGRRGLGSGSCVRRRGPLLPALRAGPPALGLLVALVVRLDELDERHLGRTAEALGPELVDARVAALPSGELLVLVVEEQRHGILVAEVAQGE